MRGTAFTLLFKLYFFPQDNKVKNEGIIFCVSLGCVFSLLCSRRTQRRRSPSIYLASREAEVGTRATEWIDTDSPYPRYLRVAGSTSGRCLLSSVPRRRSRATPASIAVIYGVDVAAIGRFRSAADEDFETSGKIGRRKPAHDRVEVVIRSE